ncbi:MAG: ornithine--oxo-acid transaminase [Promethearchaeota archaeon]
MSNPQTFIELDYKYGANNYHPLPVVLSKAKGCWVWDVSGKKYLDFLSAYSCQNLGHCHPEIIEAMISQARRVAVTSRAFHNDKMGPFLKKLCEIMKPHVNDPENVGIMALLMNTGTEAVETGLKIARAWSYIQKKIPKNKAQIIACENNFHGRSITIVSFSTNMEHGKYFDNFGPFTPGFHVIKYGDANSLEVKINELGEENVAAFILEPLQGEGGVIVPPKGYLKKIREICTAHDILLIADEIQTGLGRTGALLACDHENVQPDILILGKALGGGVYPVSAVMSSKNIMGPEIIKPGTHGSTFGGNALASAIAIKALDLLLENNLAERANKLGSYFLDKLKELLSSKNTVVPIKEIRGKGLLIGIELEAQARPIVEELMKRGLLVKETHDTIIRFAPPLIITREEIDLALKIIKGVLL